MEFWRSTLFDYSDSYSPQSRLVTKSTQVYTNVRRQLYPLKTLDEWTSVFKLAALWDMEDGKAEAIQKMTPLLEKQPAKQVKLSVEHGVVEWLVPGLNQLVQRAEPLNKDDIDLIGLDYALQIMTLREDCRYDSDSGSWDVQRRGEVPLDFAKEIQVRFNIRQ
jgi:hypothetical protein